MKLWVRCGVFFAVTYPVLYAAHFHLALWQYFLLALAASALAQGVWWLVRGNRRLAAVAGIVATLAGAASAAYAVFSVGSSVVYLVEIDEVAARPADFSGGRVRVHGYARPGSLVRTNGGLELDVVQHGHGLTVRYGGLAPDQLRDGMEIVAAGRLASAGRFDADELLVKCPSNYDRNAGPKPF